MIKIAAVVVTYNRLNLLIRTVDCLRNQSRKLDKIIIVNNNSSDGTTDWLKNQKDLYTIQQENVGGSGGFYRGMSEAYSDGFDWIWCMDDDVFPTKECLKFLLSDISLNNGIICPRRIISGKPFQGEFTKLNLSGWFKAFHYEKTPIDLYDKNKPFQIMGMAFEGPLISKTVIDKIGFPNKDLFILFDDTEYSLRAIAEGFNVILEPKAIMEKEDFTIGNNLIELRKSNSWKLFYEIRNNSYVHAKYGSNFFVKKIRPLGLLLKYYIIFFVNIFNQKYKFSDFLSWNKAYLDGQRNLLGKKC